VFVAPTSRRVSTPHRGRPGCGLARARRAAVRLAPTVTWSRARFHSRTPKRPPFRRAIFMFETICRWLRIPSHGRQDDFQSNPAEITLIALLSYGAPTSGLGPRRPRLVISPSEERRGLWWGYHSDWSAGVRGGDPPAPEISRRPTPAARRTFGHPRKQSEHKTPALGPDHGRMLRPAAFAVRAQADPAVTPTSHDRGQKPLFFRPLPLLGPNRASDVSVADRWQSAGAHRPCILLLR